MQFPSVYKLFQHSAQQFADKPFLHIPAVASQHYCKGSVDYSYQQMLRAVDEMQKKYSVAGYSVGHRVALLLENRAEFFIHWLALNALGVSVVPVNGEMQFEEQQYLLEHSESCLVVSIPEKLADISKVADSVKTSAIQVISFDAESIPSSPGLVDKQADINLQTECAMLFTSGSTGKPKGCILTNEYFLEFAYWYRDIGGLLSMEYGKERLLTPLPLVHMNAMAVSSMGMMVMGGCLIQLHRFSASSWWETVKQSEASCLHYLGVLPAILLNLPEREDDLNPQIKFGFGAGCNPKHHAKFEQRFGFPLIESWAMTECGSGGCITAFEEPRYVGTSCFGEPDSKRVEYRLVDENDEDVGEGEAGELLVRRAGSNPRKGFFSGYYKNPEATEEAWKDGWLHTGDVVRVGENGAMHFVDRRKNVIRRSGENIAALEVEATLVHCPIVEQVVVTALPDEMRGDEVLAFVIAKSAIELNQQAAQQVFDCAMDNLVYYKAPGYVVFVDSLPLTASQKPQRAEIKKLAQKIVLDNKPERRSQVFNFCDQKRADRQRQVAG